MRVGALPDSSLLARRIGLIRRVVCASPDYLAERGTPATPGDLDAHCCVSFEQADSANTWTFAVDGVALSVPIRFRLVVNTAEAAIDAAIAGVGLTVCCARQGNCISSCRRSNHHPCQSLVHTGQRRIPLKLRAFLDFAAPRLATRLESRN